jgi:hypothetical protein
LPDGLIALEDVGKAPASDGQLLLLLCRPTRMACMGAHTLQRSMARWARAFLPPTATAPAECAMAVADAHWTALSESSRAS